MKEDSWVPGQDRPLRRSPATESRQKGVMTDYEFSDSRKNPPQKFEDQDICLSGRADTKLLKQRLTPCSKTKYPWLFSQPWISISSVK